jgi:hypothetical protein
MSKTKSLLLSGLPEKGFAWLALALFWPYLQTLGFAGINTRAYYGILKLLTTLSPTL